MAKKYEPTTLFDRIHEIKAKQLFMTVAIVELLGSEHNDFSSNDDIVFGCHLLMHSITDDLNKAERLIEKETSLINIKPLKKEA